MWNFNPGSKDIVTGIEDDVNGRFSTLGWAKAFMVFGRFSKVIRWNLQDNIGTWTEVNQEVGR